MIRAILFIATIFGFNLQKVICKEIDIRHNELQRDIKKISSEIEKKDEVVEPMAKQLSSTLQYKRIRYMQDIESEINEINNMVNLINNHAKVGLYDVTAVLEAYGRTTLLFRYSQNYLNLLNHIVRTAGAEDE